MSGSIKEIIVKVGEAVKGDEALVIREAMKMENLIVVPGNGTVKEIMVKEGDEVNIRQALVMLE